MDTDIYWNSTAISHPFAYDDQEIDLTGMDNTTTFDLLYRVIDVNDFDPSNITFSSGLPYWGVKPVGEIGNYHN